MLIDFWPPGVDHGLPCFPKILFIELLSLELFITVRNKVARAIVLPLATLFRSRGDFSLTPVGFFNRLFKKIKVSAFFARGLLP